MHRLRGGSLESARRVAATTQNSDYTLENWDLSAWPRTIISPRRKAELSDRDSWTTPRLFSYIGAIYGADAKRYPLIGRVNASNTFDEVCRQMGDLNAVYAELTPPLCVTFLGKCGYPVKRQDQGKSMIRSQ